MPATTDSPGVATDEAERTLHFESARETWESINRPDLIECFGR